ncbi:MAG: hypothetical protein ACXADH_12810 [Candidatus Kariarchaeaceae archaeon]|jgi:hypothetical protein
MDICPFCYENTLHEYETVERFQYGVNDDAVVLSADVIVQECADPTCRMAWTDHRSEDARQAVVDKHLAKQGIYMCVVCKSSPVDVEQGYDTCDNCVRNV